MVQSGHTCVYEPVLFAGESTLFSSDVFSIDRVNLETKTEWQFCVNKNHFRIWVSLVSVNFSPIWAFYSLPSFNFLSRLFTLFFQEKNFAVTRDQTQSIYYYKRLWTSHFDCLAKLPPHSLSLLKWLVLLTRVTKICNKPKQSYR